MSEFLHQARFQRDHEWTPGHMSAYLEGELSSRLGARVERHTAECPECRGLLHSLRRMLDRLHGLAPASGGPAGRDVAAAVLVRLSERPGP